MESVTVEQLFADYLHYRQYTAYAVQHRHFREPKLQRERREALEAMVTWCAEQEINPRRWLYSLFAARQWVAAPRWEHLVPKTKTTERKAKARYHALTQTAMYSDRVTQTNQQQRQVAGELYDPRRDLTATTENLKRRYLRFGDTERCMAEMAQQTLGFHPRSVTCQRCPAAKACAERLNVSVGYDLVALRRG